MSDERDKGRTDEDDRERDEAEGESEAETETESEAEAESETESEEAESEEAESEEAESEEAEAEAEPPELAPAVKVQRAGGSRLQRFYDRIEPYEGLLVAAFALAVILPGIWAYTLVDPWETHYAEVARRMLEEHDWVFLKWQNEIFRSKPVFTFWLIATSLRLFGLGADGGYSGEMTSSDLVVFAVRLPFVLFGVLGVTMTWWMLARLVNRRVAWLAALVITTSPFYLLVARQSITDMPMVACIMGAVACFAMAIHAEDEPLRPIWRRINAYHLFAAALVLFVGAQLFYYLVYFTRNPTLAPGLIIPQPALFLCGPLALGLAGFLVWSWHWQPTTTRRSVYMYWFYFLVGVSILAKGPVGIGVLGGLCFFYLLLTGSWRLLPFRVELFRGLLVGALVAVPWHVAMWMRDGRPWLNEYFGYHWFKRFTDQHVHGDTGTFDYIASQVGIGMWPWAALLPAALALTLYAGHQRDREGRVRLIVGIWAVFGFAMFAMSQTKFHHYVLPAIPALAILVAFWLDDLWTGRLKATGAAAACGVAIIALICLDLMSEQKQLIELFVYRYDRPWPSGPPWNVDLSGALLAFGVPFAILVALLGVRRVRKWAMCGLGIGALIYAFWAANDYMQAAAPHWGQRALHRTYYRLRTIHGVEIKYYGLRDLAEDWGGGDDYEVRSVLPDGFKVGLPMRVTLHVPGAGMPGDKLVLHGQVSRTGDDAFWIHLTRQGEAAAKLEELIARGRDAPAPRRRPWVQVDADRLIAWQLNWRGENFWSSGEIYGETEDTRTVFMKTDNKAFLAYLGGKGRKGRRYFLITEAGRAAGLRNVLPTKRAKETYKILDTSCNKFTLLSFTL